MSTCEVSLLFSTDQKIQELNKQYRNKNKATDVLSFSHIEARSTKLISPVLGDIIISLDTAKIQARQYGTSLSLELLRLTIHGLLHLFGYEHEKVSAAKAKRMWRKQTELFELLGSSGKGWVVHK